MICLLFLSSLTDWGIAMPGIPTQEKYLIKQTSHVVGIMNRLKDALLHSALKYMYDSLTNSHLQFGTTAWGYQCNRVNKITRKKSRANNGGTKYDAHSEPLLKGCNILRIEDILKLSCLKLYHKYTNCNLTEFVNDIFTMNTDIHSYEIRNRDRLH